MSSSKYILVVMCVLVLSGCQTLPKGSVAATGKGDPPLLGGDFPREAKPIPYAFIRTTSNQDDCLYHYVAEDVTFLLAEREWKVAYIGTESKSFKTPENVSVGSTLAAVKGLPGTVEHGELEGDYSVALPSGWTAVFRYGAKRTKRSLSTDDKVVYLFKNEDKD